MTPDEANAILRQELGKPEYEGSTTVRQFIASLGSDGYTYAKDREPSESDFEAARTRWYREYPVTNPLSLPNIRNWPWIKAAARMIAGGKGAAPTPTPTPTVSGLSDAQKAQLRQHMKAIEVIAGL